MSNGHSGWVWKSEGLQSCGTHGKAVVIAHKTLVITISGEILLNIEQQLDGLLKEIRQCISSSFLFFSFFLPVKTSNQES